VEKNEAKKIVRKNNYRAKICLKVKSDKNINSKGEKSEGRFHRRDTGQRPVIEGGTDIRKADRKKFWENRIRHYIGASHQEVKCGDEEETWGRENKT